MTLWQNIGRYR